MYIPQEKWRCETKYLPKELKDEYEYDVKQCPDIEDISLPLMNISNILQAHYILLDYFSDPSAGQNVEPMLPGVRSYHLLGSAVGRQVVSFGGKNKYIDSIDICSTLFFGLVKDHAFLDGNKRTALLVLLYQLTLFGYYPKDDFKRFEKLVLSVADNSLYDKYSGTWKKYKKDPDANIKTLSYEIRRLVDRTDRSYHLNITMKEFCQAISNVDGVNYSQDGMKIKFTRRVKGVFRPQLYMYTINFYGWSRPVEAKMARNTFDALHITEEFSSYKSVMNGQSSIYKIVHEFEKPLRRLKDE